MLVGVLGFIGSGKGTVGEILEKEYGFIPISFASHLKDVTALMFDWPRHLLEGNTEESRKFRESPDEFWSKKIGNNFTPRLALQLLGTEAVRNNFHRDFWILSLEKKININENNYVITDVRFKNEIEWMKKNNAILMEIRRGEKPFWYIFAQQANQGSFDCEKYMTRNIRIHESEWKWVGTEVDFLIENNGTIDDLRNIIRENLTKCVGSNIIESLKTGVSS